MSFGVLPCPFCCPSTEDARDFGRWTEHTPVDTLPSGETLVRCESCGHTRPVLIDVLPESLTGEDALRHMPKDQS